MRRSYYNRESKFEYPIGLYVRADDSASYLLATDGNAYVDTSDKPIDDADFFVREDLVREVFIARNKTYDSKFADETNLLYTNVWQNALWLDINDDEDIHNIKGIGYAHAFVLNPHDDSYYKYLNLRLLREYFKNHNIEDCTVNSIVEPSLGISVWLSPDIPRGVKARLDTIRKLGDKWYDEESRAVPDVIVDNAERFICKMVDFSKNVRELNFPAHDNVYPTTYGSIIIDVENERGDVEIEIGDTTIGFFTDYRDGEQQYAVENIKVDFDELPEVLWKQLVYVPQSDETKTK